MWLMKFLNGNFFSRVREQFAPTLTAHDPSPPLTLDTVPTGAVSAQLGDVTCAASGTSSYTVTATTNVALGNVTCAAAATFTAPLTVQGDAFRCSGQQDALALGTVGNFTKFTFFGWVKLNSDRNDYSGVFSVEMRDVTDHSLEWNELITDVDGTTLKVFDHVTGAVGTLGSMTVGTWYRVALSVNDNGTFAAYFGTEDVSVSMSKTTGTLANITSGNNYAGILSTNFAATETADACGAMFRKWDGVNLSDAELELESKSSMPARTTNLLDQWFSQGVNGTTVLDGVVNGNDLIDGVGGGTPDYTFEAGPKLTVQASTSAQLGNVTCAASGTVGNNDVTGTVNVALGNVTCAAAGSTVVGTVSVALGNVTSSASAAHGVSGSTSVALGNVTCSSAGSSVVGTVNVALGNVTSSSTAAHGVSGSTSAALGNVTSSSTAAHGVSGSTSAALGNVTSSSTAAHGVSGSTSAALGNATCVASGSSVSGAVNVALGNVTCVSSGSVSVAPVGTVNVALGDVTCAATALVTVAFGDVNVALGNVTCAAVGSSVSGTVNVALGTATLVATGAVGASASVSTSLGNATLAAAGTVRAQGTVNVALGNVTSSSAAAHGVAGSTSVALGNVTCVATAISAAAIDATVNVALGNVTVLEGLGGTVVRPFVMVTDKTARTPGVSVQGGGSRVVIQSDSRRVT